MTNILMPTYAARSVESLGGNPECLGGIDLVAFDVDGTLTEHHGRPDDRIADLLTGLGDAGLKLCVISNAYGERVEELHDILGSPFNMSIITPALVAPEYQRASRYRKPSPAMLLHAAQTHGVPTSRVLMVGDQILKDIASANRARAKSMLVPKRGDRDDPKVRVLQRPLEAVLRHTLGIHFPEDDRVVRL